MKEKQNLIELVLCIFLGMFGVHKFYKKNYLLGILYLFTFGIFFMGWILDIVKLVEPIMKSKFPLQKNLDTINSDNELSTETKNKTNYLKSIFYDTKNIAIAVLSFILFCSTCTLTNSNNVSQINKISDLENQISALQEEKQSLQTSSSSESLQQQLSSLQTEKESLNTQLSDANTKIESLESEKTNLSGQITSLQQQVSSLESEKSNLSSQVSSLQQQTTVSTSTSSNSSSTDSTQTNSETVYITKTGDKYHRSGCSYLKSKIEIDKDAAISRGYTPCSRCNP